MRVAVGRTLIACLLLAGPAAAATIGFLDAERAVASVKEGQAKLWLLEEWARPERERVEALGAKLNGLRQQINQQRTVASAETLQALQDDELGARRSFEDARRKFERDLDAKQKEFLAEVGLKVGQVASGYARANGYEAVFVLNAQPLVYIADGADLTDTVIRLYDERFPYTGE